LEVYNDFPDIKELIGQYHAGAIQRTNEHDEMKRKRVAQEQDQMQAKKLHKEAEEDDDEE
jgi:hypothetical protein